MVQMLFVDVYEYVDELKISLEIIIEMLKAALEIPELKIPLK
jgi:hypothetical protein